MQSMRLDAPSKDNTLGLVLAGGRATRMGGVNKGLVPFKDKPMAVWVIEALSQQTSTIWVSANRDEEAFMALGGSRVIRDVLKDFPGPLAALDSLNEASLPDTFAWVLMVPCDVPLVPTDLLEHFQEAYGQQPGRAYIVSANGRQHNTIALIHRSVLSTVRAFLLRGDRKVGLWFAEQKQVVVPWDEKANCFENLNSLEDIEHLQAF